MGGNRDERYGGVGCFQMSEEFKGKIPPIAEKEKRGKQVKIPPSEIYVQELTSNVELNLPSAN